MNNIKYFLKSNKKVRKNEFFPATDSLCDEEGNVVDWELKPLTTDELETLREESIDKNGVMNEKKFTRKLICSSVVVPNLHSIDIQNSYGVKSAEELISKILDCPGDYANLQKKILDMSKLETTFANKVSEAKN